MEADVRRHESLLSLLARISTHVLVERGWPTPVFTALAAVGAGGFTFWAAETANWRLPLIALALLCAGVTAAIPLVAQRLHAEREVRVRRTFEQRLAETEAAAAALVGRFRDSITDGMIPMIEPLWDLVTSTRREDRRARLGVTFVQAAHATARLLGGERTRSVVYVLTSDNSALVQAERAGRRDPAQPFTSKDERGRRALEWVSSSDKTPLHVEDSRQAPPSIWRGSGASYRSFISVPIATLETSFGMLTVDDPEPGALTADDVPIVQLLAALLAVACAAAGAEVVSGMGKADP